METMYTVVLKNRVKDNFLPIRELSWATTSSKEATRLQNFLLEALTMTFGRGYHDFVQILEGEVFTKAKDIKVINIFMHRMR